MFKDIQIETERLVVRPLKPQDDVAFQAILSQPEVMQYLPEDVMTLQEVTGIIEWFQTCYERNTPEKIIKWTLGVWLKNSKKPPQSPLSGGGKKGKSDKSQTGGELIGWAGVGPLEPDESEIEIAYGIARDHWGQGYATEAAQAVLDYAFDTIGLKRLVAVVDPENMASVKVLENIGMTLEKKLAGLPQEFGHYEGSLFYTKTM